MKLPKALNEATAGAALKYHIKRALERSHSISDFSRNLELSAQNAKFTNNTLKIIEELNNGVKQASEEIKEAAKPSNLVKSIREQDTRHFEVIEAKDKEAFFKDLNKNLEANATPLPKGMSVEEFKQTLESVENKDRFLEHLGTRDNSDERLAALDLVEPILREPHIEIFIKDNTTDKKEYIKAFKDENEARQYMLITQDNDTILRTFIPKLNERYMRNHVRNADIIHSFIQPNRTAKSDNALSDVVVYGENTTKKPLTSQEDLLKTSENLNETTQKTTQTPLSPLEQANAEKLAKLEHAITPLKEFGKNYPEFALKPKEALEKLLQEKNGQVAGAAFREDLGGIDFVWGNKDYGLEHILKRREDQAIAKGLNETEAKEYALNIVKSIPEIIEKGVKVDNNGRIAIEYQNIRVGLKDNWKGEKLPNHWVITSYEKLENSESLYTSPLITKSEILPLNSNEKLTQKPLTSQEELLKTSENLNETTQEAKNLSPLEQAQAEKLAKLEHAITPLKEFGKNYPEFALKPKEALEKLLQEKNGQVAGAALKYHIKRALERSHSISDFSRNLELSAQNAKFSNNTLKIIEELNNGVKQASEEIKEKARDFSNEKLTNEQIRDLLNNAEIPTSGRDAITFGTNNLNPEIVEFLHKNNKKMIIEKASNKELELLADANFRHPENIRASLDHDAIAHILKRHGVNSVNVRNGEIPITNEDIANYRYIVNNADAILRTLDNENKELISAFKQINGYAVVVEQAINKKNELVLKTMYKSNGDYKDNNAYKKFSSTHTLNADAKVNHRLSSYSGATENTTKNSLTSQEDLLKTSENLNETTQEAKNLSPLEQAQAEKLAKLEHAITPLKEFGKNYPEFALKPKEALEKLLQEKNGQVAGAALKYHIKRALERSHSISEFSKNLELSAQNAKFTNNTLKIIEELNNGVKQASEEIKEKATKYENALKELQKIDESTLSKEQQQVLKVFKGELDQAEIKGIDLNDLYILEQGSRNAGSKKILIKHYGEKNTGGLTNEELINISEVIKSGSVLLESFERIKNGFRYAYEWDNNGVKIRLAVDDLNNGSKIFDFYSDRNFKDFRDASLHFGNHPYENNLTQKPLIDQEELLKTQENLNETTQEAKNLSPLEQANAEKLAKLESEKLESEKEFTRLKEQEQARKAALKKKLEHERGNAGNIESQTKIEVGEDIPTHTQAQIPKSRVRLNEREIYDLNYAIVKSQDLKPSFTTGGTQKRTDMNEEQIKSIAENFDPKKIFGSGGFEDLPIILHDGQVIAGNHRVQGMLNFTPKSRFAYERAIKEYYHIDLKPDELLVRVPSKRLNNTEINNLAASSNQGRFNSESDHAIAVLSHYEPKLKELETKLNADSIYSLKNMVAKNLNFDKATHPNVGDSNLALLMFNMPRTKTQGIELLNRWQKEFSNDIKSYEKVKKMFVDNAGSFHNLIHDMSFPNVSLNAYLSDIMDRSFANLKNYQTTSESLKDLSEKFYKTSSLEMFEKSDQNTSDISEILGGAIARFARFDDPSKALFEALKSENIKKGLKEFKIADVTKDMFDPNSKEFKDIDIYDFTHYLLMVNREPNENNPTLKRLIEAIKDMQKENEKTIKEVSKTSAEKTEKRIKRDYSDTSLSNDEVKALIDESPRTGSSMPILGMQNLNAEAVEYIQKNHKRIAVEKIEPSFAKDLNLKYPDDARAVIDYQAINHILKEHKNLSFEDIANYRELSKQANETLKLKDNQNRPVVASFNQKNGFFVVVEQVSNAKNELMLKTIYKTRGNYKDSLIYKKTLAKSQNSN
ncbi:hypothetical protein BTM463_08680 [Helicobacter pylori]